jgi:hypothetical protein
MVTDNTRRGPGGRPSIGDPVKWALPPGLRSTLADRRRPGEPEAAAARRLLAAALSPGIADALALAADTIDPECPNFPNLDICARLAAQLRTLAADIA